MATTGSPKISPHPAKPRSLVRILGAFLVAAVDQLREEVGAAVGDRQIADLVDDQERCPAVESQFLDETALALRPGQGFE